MLEDDKKNSIDETENAPAAGVADVSNIATSSDAPIDEYDAGFVPTNSSFEEELSGGASVKNTVITVGAEKYAVGLFWQPLQDTEDSDNEIRETAETIADGADLFCIREGSTQQYALGVSGDIKSGTKVAGAAVADAFSDKPSSVAVFKVEEGWWFLAVRSDLILAEDDKLYVNEDDAKQAFYEMMAVPDWGRKIAPPEWNIGGTTYIELEDILRRSSFLKLSKIGSGKNAKKLWIGVAVAIALIYGVLKIVDALTVPPPPVYKPVPKIVKKAPAPVVVKKAPEEPPPWTALNNPVYVMSECYTKIKQLEEIAIPGWTKSDISCVVGKNSASVSSSWKRSGGRIAWFSDALDKLGIKKEFNSAIADGGSSGTISSSFKNITKMSSAPDLSGKDIKLQLLDIFDAIGIDIVFGSATEGEIKDPNNPNARPRPKYFVVKFSFTTEYQPETWMNVLSQFSALTVTNIRYNVEKKTWSYEGKIYERRI